MTAISPSSAGCSGEGDGDVPGREHGGSVPLALSQSWLLELVLEKVPKTKDRNSCSLVCKDFKDAERQTRKHVRLRCLRKEVKLMPSCFQAVTDLDLSSMFPQFVTKFSYPITQLKNLGRCFPNVRSLTFFCDGCQAWLKKNRLPFEGTWPMLETVTVLQPGYHQSYPSYKESSGGRITYGPLRLKLRTGSSDVEHSQRGGIALKEVHFHVAGQSELEALAEDDVANLDTLSFHMQRAALPPPDLSILSSARFPLLENVSVSVNVYRGTQHVATDDTLKEFLVALPHCTRSLCVNGPSGPELTTIPLPSELAGSLRILRLKLQRSPWLVDTLVDLSPILECTSLEVLELANPSVLTVSTHLDVLVAILEKCRALRSLKLDLWDKAFSQTPEELCLVLNRIALASSETLTEVGISTLSWSKAGDIFASFNPFRSQVASLGCRIRTPTGQSLETVGWPLLIHLDLDLVGVHGALSIECPNLHTLKLRMAPTELNLVGEHTKLASAVLHFSNTHSNRDMPDSMQIFMELQKLKSLTELSVFNMTRSEAFWKDKKGAEAMAALPFLEKLLISYREDSAYVWAINDFSKIHESAGEFFKPLLASPSLTELRVHEPALEKSTERIFEKLYGHRQEAGSVRWLRSMGPSSSEGPDAEG